VKPVKSKEVETQTLDTIEVLASRVVIIHLL